MGGRVGLKGTDGKALDKARALGAGPVAPEKAVIALRALIGMRESIDIITYPVKWVRMKQKNAVLNRLLSAL